jgi:hypothetical protein
MIALLLGWRLTKENYFDTESGERRQRQVWLLPRKDEIARVPLFTGNLTDAHDLAKTVVRAAAVGFSWEPGMASAKIGEGSYFQSVSPAIALCLAALSAMKEQKQTTGVK